MKLDRTIRIGLVTSITATAIFLYVLKPVISITSKIFYALFSRIHTSTIDKIFKEAALGQANDYGLFCLQLIVGIITGFIVGFLVMSFVRDKEKSYEKEKPDVLKVELKKTRKKFNMLRLGLSASTLIMICLWLFFSWSEFFTLRTLTSFKQHLAILSPYMTETEKTEILSKWALMKCRADYDVISEKLNSLAASKRIELPKNPIY